MAYISYQFLWRNEFYHNVSAKHRVQKINPNHLKLKVNDGYKKDEKITTNSSPSNHEHVVNKVCLDAKLSKLVGYISYTEKDYNGLKGLERFNEVLIERAMKTTIETLYEKGLLDNNKNTKEVIKDNLLIEVNERR